MRMFNNRTKRKGSALLTALFFMTMVAIAATAMSTRLQLDIYRTRLAILSDKLYLASEAITFWSMDQLRQNKVFITNKYGQVLQYPTSLERIYPEVKLSGAIYDLQAKFNLNNLNEKKYKVVFLRLLEKKLPKLRPEQRQLIVDATSSWVHEYQPGKGQEKWMEQYLLLKPPYLPSCQPMQSVSELRLISGLGEKNYQALLPFITALPETTPFNLNTMPQSLLAILGNGVSDEQAMEIIRMRGDRGFKNLNDANKVLIKLHIPPEQITLESTYFLSVASVSLENLNLEVYVLLKRAKTNTQSDAPQFSMSVLNESLNTF